MQIKRFILVIISILCIILLGSVFVACDNDDENALESQRDINVIFDDGVNTISITIKAGEKIDVNDLPSIPFKEGYERSWNYDGSIINESVLINVVDVPKKYSISYELGEGTQKIDNVNDYTIETETFTLINPTKPGYTFIGWSGTDIDGTSMNVSVPKGSVGNRAYIAKWTPVDYTISYNLDGGSVDGTNPTSYTIESDDITLINPTKTDYTFIGWSGTEIDDKSKSVAVKNGSYGNRTYTANWKAIDYNITYNLYGGTNSASNPSTYTLDNVVTLYSPAKTGYTFDGWYSDSGFSNQVTSIPKGSSGDKTLYAKWIIKTYTIAYILDDGSVDGTNPTSYTIESDDIVLVNPTKTGYDFNGWSGTGIDDKSKSVIVKNGSYGDRSYVANWQVNDEMNNFEFSSTSTTFTITGIKDKTVTSIIIPDYVTCIGDGAFEKCSNLTSVTIGQGVTSIGDYAFSECNSLNAVNITDLSAWCNISFGGISANPLFVAKSLYLSAELVTNLVIPDTVTEIKSFAFYNCSGLTSITIPNSVESIGGNALYGCYGLASITIGSGNTAYQSEVNCIIKTSTKELILGCKNSVIPTDGSVESIGANAFYNCSGLTSLDIPDSVTSIGANAFYNCRELTSITIGNSVTSIGNSAFCGCSKLTSVTIPNSVKSIGEYAFYNCSGLTSLDIPDNVTSIGKYAFSECSGLTSVTIGNGVVSIVEYTFSGCSSLTSINISNSVKWIWNRAFYNCSSLTSIAIPGSVENIGDSAFYGCSSLESMTLEKTGKWWYRTHDYSDWINKTNGQVTPLGNASEIATYFTNNYYYYYWYTAL